jgi:hypothetical protein
MSEFRNKKPISEKQLAANRANAAKSTGPTSPDGRARSSRNSCKHGLASEKFTVVHLEDINEVAHLRAHIIAAYQPVNSQELYALEQLAIRQQAMLRCARFEAGLFSACLNESLGPDGSVIFPLNNDVTYGIEITQAQNRNYCLADGFFRLARQGNGIQLFLRYQAQVERLYRRAVEEFERVKKLRPELSDEPISEDDEPIEPEENTNDSSPQEPSPNEPISSPPLRPCSAGDLVAGDSVGQTPGSARGPLDPPRSPIPASDPQSPAPIWDLKIPASS